MDVVDGAAARVQPLPPESRLLTVTGTPLPGTPAGVVAGCLLASGHQRAERLLCAGGCGGHPGAEATRRNRESVVTSGQPGLVCRALWGSRPHLTL